MPATTVRVERRVKRELDRLQRRLERRRGERVSQSELLARLLRHARRDEASFLEEAGGGWTPPTREEMRRVIVRSKGMPRTDVRHLDRDLYR